MPKEAAGSFVFAGGRGHLVGLDEPHAEDSIFGGKESQKAFAVAVLAADDFLLPPPPVVHADEIVEHGLHVAEQVFVGHWQDARGTLDLFAEYWHDASGTRRFLCGRAVAVPAADDIADAVFKAIYKTYIYSLGKMYSVKPLWIRL